ncbi:unnamed protein product [Cylindrotheca closterium]|uniref:HSF-type DNA-binding domain-containing protein n=1 Tax=Cylindrotheca closterium TaxID=2856 RepID=A0AAD2CS60_9STRA|nr:unnamed protein product [Cylindrotheca closterium]
MSQSTFPYRLHQVLATESKTGQPDSSSVISWTPSGNSFRIHDQNAFETEILPKYFPKQSKYGSFRRQLQYYGFTTLGLNHFGHPLFIRDQEEQLIHIKHKKGQATQAKKSTTKQKQKKERQIDATPSCSKIANHLRGAQSRSSQHLRNMKHSQQEQASKQLMLTRRQLDLDLLLALQQRRGYIPCAKQQTLLSQPRSTDYSTAQMRVDPASAFIQLARMQLGL